MFGKSCSTVKSTLINQIKHWSTDDCSAKQQCKYKVCYFNNGDIQYVWYCIVNMQSKMDVVITRMANIVSMVTPSKFCMFSLGTVIPRPLFTHSSMSSAVTSLCQYIFQYLGEEGPTIRGLHRTPLMNFVDNFNFTLTDSSGHCYVKVGYLFAGVPYCEDEY